MITIPGRIPISIHPFFWIFAAVIGFLMSGTILGAVLWIFIILVSVLMHEMGHAVTSIIFKQNPHIQLVALGGLTSYEGKNLKYWQQFIIVLNGPLFGLLLCGISTVVLWSGIFQMPVILKTFKILQIVNLFWSIVNLLPVLPLDGGQLLRIALEGAFGVKGFKISLLVGFIIAALLALGCFAMRFYLMGALFFLFAFQSFDMYRRSKNISAADRDSSLADELKKAEALLQNNQEDKAREILERIINKTKSGLIYVAAVHYLALIYFNKKENKQAYGLLLSIKDHLQEDAICIMHKLAFENKNYALVKKLSASCYKLHPSFEVAITNARTFGILNEAKPAGGWLKTAKGFEKIDINKVVQESFFDSVRDSKTFKDFLNLK